MGVIPRALEDAVVAYLVSCATPASGGLWRFLTEAGLGVSLDIRPGHYSGAPLSADGFIVCECVGNAVQQELIGINAFRAVVAIHLVMPGASLSGQSSSVEAFDYVAGEISSCLVRPEAMAETNRAAVGVVILGPREGISVESSIEDGARRWTWVLSLMVAASNQRAPI